jgi:hypothetical protein
MRVLFLLILLGAVSVAAQDLPDSGLPDASVGQGGADRDNEEGDGEGSLCTDSSTCATRLQCVSGRCVPTRVTNAGCSAGGVGLAVSVLAGALVLRRRR